MEKEIIQKGFGKFRSMYSLKQIPSECQIKKLVRKILFGTHMHCPGCKSRRIYKSEKRYRCRDCRKPFSLTSNTWLTNMKLPWEDFYVLLWCWLNHMPIAQSINVTELSEVTIREWFDKFRANLTDSDWLKPLANTVQMDEAFFRDRAVIAAKDVSSKRVVLRVIPKADVQKQNIA